MKNICNSFNRNLHHVVARELCQMISSLATDSLSCESGALSHTIENANGVVTQVLPVMAVRHHR